MTYKIITQEARTFLAEDVVEDVIDAFNSRYVYYVFLGKHTQYSINSDTPTRPVDTEDYKRQVYDDMIFGKKVSAQDARIMVNRNDYVSNVVYSMYDDKDENLYTKQYFVNVKRGNDYDVFKCLYNSNDRASTVPPNKLDITSYDEIYRTSDGYIWKYMYTVPYADMEKFSTDAYIPVVPNTENSSASVNGAIDVIAVEAGGTNYNNHLSGTIGASDLYIDGNFRKINVSGNNKSSTVDDFYIGCIFKIVSGTGTGSYSRIESYDVSGSNRVVTLRDVLDIDLTSEYEITPEVRITGDYTQTVNAEARAIINSVANSVDYVEILNRGEDYKTATAYVYSSTVVPVTSNAIVRPIMSPYKGHGYDSNNELGASKVCFSVTFNESADGLPTINDFRQIGVLSNPKFANVVVNFSSKDPTSFISGETAYQINPVRMFAESVSINTSSNSVTADTAYFDQLEPNTIIYLVGGGTKQLATVTGITNSTSMTIDTVGSFSCTDCQIFLANVSAETVVINDMVSSVAVREMHIPYDNGANVVGYESGASGTVSNMKLANTATDLASFNQMWKYYVTTTDTFEDDEIVFQSESAANSHGNFFGIDEVSSEKVMYLTNQFGYINTGYNVVGNSSGSTAYVISSYEPDLIYNSGRVIYLENIEKVARTTGQKETFKIIFSY